MALEKQFTTVHGAQANYWKVDQIEVDYHNQKVFVKVNPYVNKSNRDNGFAPILDNSYETRLKFVDVTASDSIRQNVYIALKTQKFFEGAIDVLEAEGE